MYTREKHLFRHDNHNPRRSHRNVPSFSSSLLDEICRSIDGKPDHYSKSPHTAAPPRFSRASLVDKWMENDKTVFRRRENAVFPDNDPFFFSSTSTSSDSSDADLYTNRPKPIRTRADREKDCYLFDDYEEHERIRGGGAATDDLITSKSRAMKIYANLKKMKQPISPGAKLTSFFNSIFTRLNRKKSRKADRNAPKSAAPSLAKTITRKCAEKEMAMGDVIERAPRFVNLAPSCKMDDRAATAPCRQTSVVDGKPPLPPNTFRNRIKCSLSKDRYERDDEKEEEEEEDVEDISESSSDLFELDHLSMFGINDRFCQELPVYATTSFDNMNYRLFR